MIFDELWRAERKAIKEDERLSKLYKPALREAKKKNDQREFEALEGDYQRALRFNNGPEVIRTTRLVRRARNLGIILPTKPDWQPPSYHDNEHWLFNVMHGGYILTEKAEFDLRQVIRKEESEQLEHRMRYISRIIIPLTGLLATITGLIGTLIGYFAVHHSGK